MLFEFRSWPERSVFTTMPVSPFSQDRDSAASPVTGRHMAQSRVLFFVFDPHKMPDFNGYSGKMFPWH